MRLPREFIVGDIIDYENREDKNILLELACAEPFICVELIRLGNKCSEDEAIELIQELLEKNNIYEIAEQLAQRLIPEQNVDDDKTIKCTEHKRFSDIL